ncbi:MAG: hypothetical protein OXC99_04005 [Chloroflexi bacterium]|nr:hypothetical protein [Chloroflexota bacterium]
MMTVKDAVETAKNHVLLLFGAEDIGDLGLEEIYFDPDADCWNITIGFTRPWDRKLPLATSLYEKTLARSYKTVSINTSNGDVLWVKDRILKAWD